MNTNELHEELLRIGRQPVPAPRPEFVEDLLHRIQLSEDLPLPAPVPLVPRQPWIRFRMVAAGAVAAALLAAVGLFSLANEHNNGNSTQVELKALSAQPVSDQSKTFEVRSDGTVVGESAPIIEATCTADARIKVGDGVFECKAKDRVKLEIDVPAAKVTDAQNLTTNQGVQPVAASAPTQLAVPPTTAAPKSSSPASTTPTTAGAPLASATATALPTTTTTTPPAAPSGPLGGAGTAPIIPSTTFDLTSTTNDTQVTVSWPTYSGLAFSRYVLLRTLSQTDQLPDTPTWSAGDTSNVVKTFDKADGPSYTVLLDGKALMQDGKTVIPVNTPLVSFRVAVVDSNDNLLALSSTLTLQLKWTVKPSSDPLTPGTTTSTTSTSSTSSTTTSTSSTTTSTTASTSTTK